jgi:catechol 2,3-dioxygenase-like lactoylglutathione lyase family enzyme
MKRFHVHVHVDDLQKNIAFYSAMFAAQPTRVEDDYAKWMLEDPRINFAISSRGGKPGVGHLGFQVDSDDELGALKDQAQKADITLLNQGRTSCCYAKSDKYWVTDPQGVAWEQFHTLGNIPLFDGEEGASCGSGSACCPAEKAQAEPVRAKACCA